MVFPLRGADVFVCPGQVRRALQLLGFWNVHGSLLERPCQHFLNGGQPARAPRETYIEKVAVTYYYFRRYIHRIGSCERRVGRQVGYRLGEESAIIRQYNPLRILIPQIDAAAHVHRNAVAATGELPVSIQPG